MACNACPAAQPSAVEQPLLGLKVPLPPGWSALPQGDNLLIGPAARSVLLLELSDESNTDAALQEALEREEDVQLTQCDESVGFNYCQYTIKMKNGVQPAFVGVRRQAERSARCSSVGRPSLDDVVASLRICGDVSWVKR